MEMIKTHFEEMGLSYLVQHDELAVATIMTYLVKFAEEHFDA